MNLTMPACRSQSTAGGRQRPYRNTALRDGARTSTRTSSVAKGRTASIHCRPAPPRQTEAPSSRTISVGLLLPLSFAPLNADEVKYCFRSGPAKSTLAQYDDEVRLLSQQQLIDAEKTH